MAFDRQQHYLYWIIWKTEQCFTSISLPTFFWRKTTKFLLVMRLTSEPRHKDDRRWLPGAYKGQRGSGSPYISQRRAEPLLAPSAAAAHVTYREPVPCKCRGVPRSTFVTRRRALSRDLGAEMLLIMRPDKPRFVSCALYNKKNIPWKERATQQVHAPVIIF